MYAGETQRIEQDKSGKKREEMLVFAFWRLLQLDFREFDSESSRDKTDTQTADGSSKVELRQERQ